jgi:predicted GNAT family acetyltransferase
MAGLMVPRLGLGGPFQITVGICATLPAVLRPVPVTLDSLDDAVGPALRRSPIENQVPIHLMQRVREDPDGPLAGIRIVAFEDVSTGHVGVAVQTPPHKVVVSMTTPAVAQELGRTFAARHPETSMVHGPDEAAWAFASGAGAVHPRLVTQEGLYALPQPPPQAAVSGLPRLATDQDAAILQRWLDAFVVEAVPTSPRDPSGGERLGRSGRAWLWLAVDGTPVSMAYNSRRVEGWWSVGPVYTPPEHRGRGYATALVTHLSEWAFANGAIGCTLFTDLANPVSNRIYERIGYCRVGTCATVAW